MALILEDRVKVNTTTTGTGTVVLANTAPAGYQTFAVIGNNNTTYYTIAGQTTSEWEVGIGTYYLANSSLSRDTILSSSAANAAVTFSAGTKDVFVTYPSEQAVYEDASNIVTITSLVSSNVLISGGQVNGVAHTGGSINNMTIGATTANTGSFTNITATTINSTSTTLLATSSGNVGVGITSPTAKLHITNTGAGNSLLVEDSANPDASPFVIDSSGFVVSGYTTNLTNYQVQIVSANPLDMMRWNATSPGATSRFLKSRSATVGTYSIVASGDTLGTLAFAGDDGTQFVTAASISASVDGTPGLNDMPGRLVFSTTADGASTATERMRIDSTGNVAVDTNVLFVDAGNNRVGIGTAAPAALLDVQAASNASITARVYNANTNSATQTIFQLQVGGKAATFFVSYAGNYIFNQGTGGLIASYVDYDTHYFRNNAGANQFVISSTASANNYAQVIGGLGVGPTISAAGADTNIDLKLTPKGTGYANITSGGVKLGNSTIQDSAGNLVFTTGGANTTAFTIDGNQVSAFNGSIEEKVTVSATAAAANVNFDAVTQNILFYTSNATANTTINLRGSATIPLNNAMSNGQSISLVFMNTQGNTAYYVSGYQIDGVAVTPKWQGNSAPTSGNARGIDVYSLTAIKTANATYTVLASQTQFA